MKAAPRIRDDLRLHEGPFVDGHPTWVVEDPAAGGYYRVGPVEMEIIARLGRGSVAEAINRETAFTVDQATVDATVEWLATRGLLAASPAEMARHAKAKRQGLGRRLLHGYVSFRIPLLRPDRLVGRLTGWLSFASGSWFRWGFFWFALLVGFMVAERSGELAAQLPGMMSWEGALLFAAAAAVGHAVHELGHAVAAKRHGCRVPTMGLLFIVFVPLPYTDVTDAWRLKSRRSRVEIGLAGVLAELRLAVAAAFLWCLLPDGSARSAALALWTASVAATVALNASPFMRFDAYYVLCDLTGVANLQPRSFALACHALRRLFLGVDEPAPEHVRKGLRPLWIAYALACWAYRLAVYTAIAAAVYHLAFKTAGMVLWALEIWFFMLRPVVAEIGRWPMAEANKVRMAAVVAGLSLLAAPAFLPLDRAVLAPAVAKDPDAAEIASPAAGVVEAIGPRRRGPQPAGTLVATVADPRAVGRGEALAAEIRSLRRRLSEAAADGEVAAGTRQLVARLEKAERESAALAESRANGRVSLGYPADLEPERLLGVGSAVGLGSPLAVARPGLRAAAYGYVAETDLARIAVGSPCVFLGRDGLPVGESCRVAAIQPNGTKAVDEQALHSSSGGPVEVSEETGLAAATWHQVIADLGPAPLAAAVPGHIVIRAEPTSWSRKAWAYLVKMVRTETSF